MLRGLRRLRPSPALVVASVALTISLGGVGYAATQLPRNSVGAAQLRNNAVSSAKVKNHSLKGADFAHGVVRRGARGPAGAAGPTGPQGATGPRGATGVGIGGSCSGGGAISAVASTGTVSCQPPATDSAAGYLTAADHASFGAARTYTHSFAALAGQTFSGGNEFFHTATITIPANLSKLFVVWEGEWQGGTSSTPSTLTCSILLDNVHYASRHSTSSGGYADLSTSALLDVTAGTRHVGIDCSLDTGSATIHNTNLTAIATE